MELPQPRPYGSQGKSTHDFLSLYSQVQDPIPPQGSYPKTHDFLQPLERVGKPSAKEENMPPEKPTPPVTPFGEHVLPGGIGTYSINHISYFNQRVPKPEGGSIFTTTQTDVVDHVEENSNGSSHTGSGFTLWEETAVKKGKTGKENYSGARLGTGGGKIGGGQWAALERPSQSSSNIATTTPNHLTATTSFSSRSSSQPPSQKNHSFMDMLRSATAAHDEDDEDEEELILKKEASPQPYKSELTVKTGSGGGKGTDQKPNTPRSKHSATEQRRRSKINDRFHMLRELIPNSDQKRDKASFLLEVIEYIQYLQEKVHKYEGPYQGWNQELPKLMPWRSNKQSEGYADKSQDQINDHIPNMAFVPKFDENGINSPTNSINAPKVTGFDMKNITNLTAINHYLGLPNQASHIQTSNLTPDGNASKKISLTPTRAVSDMPKSTSQPQFQFMQGLPRVPDCDTTSNKLKEQDLTIESGVISISTVYSQGLLNTLTQALQSSGIDLSQANISVQIDLGKRGNSRLNASASADKDDDIRHINQVITNSRGAASSGDEPDQDRKRLKAS